MNDMSKSIFEFISKGQSIRDIQFLIGPTHPYLTSPYTSGYFILVTSKNQISSTLVALIIVKSQINMWGGQFHLS